MADPPHWLDLTPPPPSAGPDPPPPAGWTWPPLPPVGWTWPSPPPGVDWQTKWNYYLPVVLRTRAVKIRIYVWFNGISWTRMDSLRIESQDTKCFLLLTWPYRVLNTSTLVTRGTLAIHRHFRRLQHNLLLLRTTVWNRTYRIIVNRRHISLT